MSSHSDTSEALSDISIHAPREDSPNEGSDFPLAQNAGIRATLLEWKDSLVQLPHSLKNDLIAMLSFQIPSKMMILLLIVPAFVILIAVFLVLLIVRIVHGSRTNESSQPNYTNEFIVFGDYGRNGMYGQQEMADQLVQFCSSYRCDFVVTTGDNIYDTGVSSVDDPLFKSSFEDVYLKGSLKDLKFYHVLGNHDSAGCAQCMIDYANKDSTNWVLDDYHYARQIGDIQFVFADTTPFNNEVHPSSNKEEMEPRHSREGQQKQADFIDQTFKSTDAKWKFLVGHHPVISAAQHGDNMAVTRYVDPILKNYDVDAYIAGHDHNQQHLVRSNIDYFVSGAASKLRPISMADHWNLQWSDAHHGWMHFKVAEDHVLVQAISSKDRSVMYEHKITKE